MTKSLRKNVLVVGIELGAACMPSGQASDRATSPGNSDSRDTKRTDKLFVRSIYFSLFYSVPDLWKPAISCSGVLRKHGNNVFPASEKGDCMTTRSRI